MNYIQCAAYKFRPDLDDEILDLEPETDAITGCKYWSSEETKFLPCMSFHHSH